MLTNSPTLLSKPVVPKMSKMYFFFQRIYRLQKYKKNTVVNLFKFQYLRAIFISIFTGQVSVSHKIVKNEVWHYKRT